MRSLTKPQSPTQEVVNKITVAPPHDLERWDDTDPADWPAEWADAPLDLYPTAKGVGTTDTPRGLSRRRFLALATMGGLTGGLAGGAAALAVAAPGPLERAYREVLAAQAVLAGWEDDWDRDRIGIPEDVMDAAVCRSADAMRELVRRIVAACPTRPRPLEYGRLVDNRSCEVAGSVVENGKLYLLIHEDHGSAEFRPIVLDMGGLR